jgi:hypothetical protein
VKTSHDEATPNSHLQPADPARRDRPDAARVDVVPAAVGKVRSTAERYVKEVNGVEETKECARCGRRLKSPKAKALGYGMICWQKIQAEQADQAATEQKKEKEQPKEATA